MANNRIPRNAKKIYITWKVDTTGSKAGDRATVEKTERGWILTTESGKRFYMPLALLRNADAVQVDQIEADEPNNRKDVLLSDIGTQVYIIDGASRTDKAAQAVIAALCNNGRITGELAERAKNDRPTLDKIKRNLLHVQMEERETETGMRWTFYTESGVYMDIPSYSRNYIRADKQGNLYPAEAPTEEETSTTGQDTTCTDKEPQEGTETAQKVTESRHKYGMRLRGYSIGAQPAGVVERADDPTGQYYDIITYNRELTPEEIKHYSLTPLEAAESREEIEPQEDTTTPETDAQRAKETAKSTIQTGERVYSHPHRHMVTFAGLQDGLVMVVYRGRLYLVSANDLYTDESETTPAMLPQATESAEKTADDTTPTAGDTEPQRAAQSHETTTSQKSITTPTEGTQEAQQTAGTSEGGTTPPHTEPPRATDAAAGSVSQSDRRTRPAAPQSHGTTKGTQRHHRPPKTAYRAIQRAGRNTGRSSPDRRKVTFSAWMYKTGSDPPKI